MYEFKDPARLTRIAIGFLILYLAANAAVTALDLAAMLGGAERTPVVDPDVAQAFDLLLLFATLACYVVIGRWIYRASANAHALSNDLEITPGWAVGWYFVPIANLFKPYQAMKETWIASHFGGDGEGASLLGAWWALWLASGFLGRFSSRWTETDLPGAFDVAGGAVDVALALVLITLMRRLAAAQTAAFRWDVFA